MSNVCTSSRGRKGADTVHPSTSLPYGRGSLILLLLLPLLGCQTRSAAPLASSPIGAPLPRSGDEIIVCGQYFHTGTPVVLWTDPGGYDAYRVERRFVTLDHASYSATTQEAREIDTPNRYGVREAGLTPEELEQVRGGGWPLELLQKKVDLFVIHYDVAGVSRECFRTLHDVRNLSVHFMLDLDGTIYQTLDLKERAWHAGEANSRSVGIEIANVGAYPLTSDTTILRDWYKREPDGSTRITIPAALGDGGLRSSGNLAPIRPDPVYGWIHHARYRQYDFTTQQYAALARLTATLCRIFPNLACDYPRSADGQVLYTALTKPQLDNYHGLLGHWHLTAQKQDPGPAFQWEHLITDARALMR